MRWQTSAAVITTSVNIEREIFIDQKPDSFALAGDHERLTEPETLAIYGVDSENV